ncbi:MAG: DUF4340 domain-containing protein [Gemmatimonadetes bacterium]|jgi:hypothetical protein|nr:DUF4340 domain-containing protein [Gemmatimonadota bacterium]
MKLKSVLLISLIFGLLLIAVFYSNQHEKEQAETEQYSRELLDFNKDQVDELTIAGKGGKVVCRRIGGQWKIVEPINVNAARGSVLAVLANLERARLKSFVMLEDDDDDELLEEYGLQPASVTVILRVQGSILDTIRFGSSPFGKYVYVKKASESRVGMTEIYRRTGVDRDANALREKRALIFENSQATGLHIESLTDTVEAAKTNGTWRLQRPEARADEEEVEAFLTSLASGATSFVDDAPDGLSKYGLDPPAMRVDVSVNVVDGASQVQSLWIGAAKDDAYYAKDVSRQAVFTLDSTMVNQLPAAAFKLRHKHLLDFDRKTVDRIEFTYPERVILCVQNESSWMTVAPPQSVNGSEIEAILFNMAKLKAQAFVPESAEAARSQGLDAPRLRIRIWTKDQLVGEIAFGDTTGGRIYAKGSDIEFVSLVDETEAAKLTAERIFARE